MLDENEYCFLTSSFETMSPSQLDEMPGYIVSNRNSNMKKLVDMAIENELSELQREVVMERYFSLLSINEIAELHCLSRTQIYRILEAAFDKLYNSLKYAYYCGFSLLCPPENFEEVIKGEKYEYRYS